VLAEVDHHIVAERDGVALGYSFRRLDFLP
jgi:hypothetical protein